MIDLTWHVNYELDGRAVFVQGYIKIGTNSIFVRIFSEKRQDLQERIFRS